MMSQTASVESFRGDISLRRSESKIPVFRNNVRRLCCSVQRGRVNQSNLVCVHNLTDSKGLLILFVIIHYRLLVV